MAHTKSGTRPQLSPRARIVWVVTMKFTAVMIDETPRMKMPITTGRTPAGVVVLYGG